MHLQKAKACKTSEYNLYGVAVFTTYFIARRALFEELTIRNAGYRMKQNLLLFTGKAVRKQISTKNPSNLKSSDWRDIRAANQPANIRFFIWRDI